MTPTGARATVFAGVRTPASPSGPAAVMFRDGKVEAVAPGEGPLPRSAGADRAEADRVEGRGLWLLPGWIDIQVNDLAWMALGLRSADEHRDRMREVLAYQVARGVTGVALATLAAPEEEILSYLRGAAQVLRGGGPFDRALLGVLVEGTFMNPAHCGAHNPAYVRPPDLELLDRLLATGSVRLINIAPETSPQALEAIRFAVRRGAVVGCGHAKPSGERLREAASAGLSYLIHLGNGPTGSSLKAFSEGGMMEESLRNDGLAASLILDGVHLDPRLVRDIVARKEVSRVIGTSDAGFATGPPRGQFTAFGIRGEVSEDGRYLRVLPPSGSPPPNPLSSDAAKLFGSVADMRDVFENSLNWLTVEMEGIYHRRHPALPFEEAVQAAVSFASRNPAQLLSESDRGDLLPGKRADAVLASIEGKPGRYRVEVRGVWLAGERAPPRPS